MENKTQQILDTVTPMGFKITNKTDKTQVVKLFDINTKYNNDANIKIDVLLPHGENKTYDELIAETHHENKVFGLISINSENTEQVVEIITITCDEGEDEPSLHVVPQTYFTVDQIDPTFINIVRETKKNQYFVLWFHLQPNTEMAIRFYDAIEQPIEINITEEELMEEDIFMGNDNENTDYEINVTNSTGENLKQHNSEQKMCKTNHPPIQLIVKNTTKETKLATLFGFSKNYLKVNYGSQNGIEIKSNIPNITYGEILTKLAFNPIETSLIKINAKSEEQAKQIITLTAVDTSGQSCTMPIITESYWSKLQKDKNQVEIPYTVAQDESTEWSFNVLPEEEVIITLFYNELPVNLFGLNSKLKRFGKLISEQSQDIYNLTQRLELLENKKSWWQKWFSKSK